MNAQRQNDLLVACHALFGRDFECSFLFHLEESGLRAAWRRRALETHPDRHAHLQRGAAADAAHFIAARRAYDLLRAFLSQRPRPVASQPAAGHPRPRPRRAPTPRRADRPEQLRLPRRRLRLGEYLYHSRVIPFPALIDALLWQRRQRERFCEIVLRWGYLTVAETQLLLRARHAHEPVGATAQRLRLLNAFQVRTVLHFQRSRQAPLGSYFVGRGLIAPGTLSDLLLGLERHNAGFPRAS